MSEKHTIEQLQAMPDAELGEIAAKLRGYKFDADTSELLNESGSTESFGGLRVFKLGVKPYCENSDRWNPAADIAQAYGLLTWAMERDSKIEFHLHLMRRRSKTTGQPCIFVYSYGMSGSSVMYEVSGNDARAMVYAFVLAMQEVINGK